MDEQTPAPEALPLQQQLDAMCQTLLSAMQDKQAVIDGEKEALAQQKRELDDRHVRMTLKQALRERALPETLCERMRFSSEQDALDSVCALDETLRALAGQMVEQRLASPAPKAGTPAVNPDELDDQTYYDMMKRRN